MAKQKKYEFNQQFATLRLREPINEGRVMFTIDDQKVDDAFMNDFEADVDYIHDGPDVYYVTDQNELERFVDYIESMGLDSSSIKPVETFKEEGSVTGGEAYLPAMNVPSKKQNPFKEDVLSGYTQDKNFRPGHTADKGGFQYKDLWGLNESENLEATKQKVISWSKQNRNPKQGSLETQWYKEFEDAVMNANSKQEIRDAVLDMYYADDAIFNKLGLMDLDYDDSEKSTDPLMKKSTSNEEELQRVQGLLDRANQEKSYSVMSSYEDKIKKLKFLVALEKKINDKLPLFAFSDYWVDYVKNKLAWNGNPNKLSDIATHVQGLMEPPYKVKMETLNEMNQIVDEIFSREDYQKVLQIIDKIKYTNTALYNAIMDLVDDLYPHDYKEVEALVSGLNENYSKFKNETKTRTKPEQFHQAVKSVKRKVEEINKLYTYMERLQLELSEDSDGLKYKKYTESAILKIKEAVKALHVKTKKLK